LRRAGTLGANRLEQEGGTERLVTERGLRRIAITPAVRDPRALIAYMDDARIDVAAVSAAPPLLHYELDGATGREVAQALNRGLAELVRAFPDRFALFATVPLQDPAAAVAELDRIAGAAAGVEIGTNVNGANLDDPGVFPFFRRAEELGLVIFVHPHHVLGSERLEQYYLFNLLGNPMETGVAIASLVFGGVLERLPRLRVLFCHGGGVLPFVRGRWRHGYAVRPEPAAAVPRPPDEYLGRLYFDSIVHDAAALRFLVETVSSERVVLGSDYPFEMGDRRPVDAIESLPGLSARDRAKICGENALRLLGR
jgi:aminocarboxymuconate-semialdehyde decarboxylase